MRKLLTILLLTALFSVTADARTEIGGRFGKQNGFTGRFPLTGGIGSGTPLPSGKILLVDGVSFILKVDGTSKICRAGGC